jgi:taurine dioxygenase
MTTQILGLSADESRSLLDELFEWIVRPEFVYTHAWQRGDCLLWDNACTMHKRDPFDQTQQRLMKRTTILPQPEFAVPV